MQYINLRSLHRLIGVNYPLGVNSLANSLERFLQQIEGNGDNLPCRLLDHNINGRRNREISEFAHVDVDFRLDLDVQSGKSDLVLLDYRVQTQHARNETEKRVVIHINMKYPDRANWAIHLPLQALIKGFGDVEEGYMCYAHTVTLMDTKGIPAGDGQVYCGITSRNWLERMNEHFREIRSGSNKLFHRAWREFQGRSDVMLSSELVALNHTYEGAMDWEEWIVNRYMDSKTSLNMIPGGFKGLRELHKLGYLSGERGISVVERDNALLAYAKEHPRVGMPNLLIAGLWEDDEYYTRVIESRDNTLNKKQVSQIWDLYQQGWSAQRIADEVAARNIGQVRRVIAGKTYSRMK